MKYNKILAARNSPENKCFAGDGEWLIVGQADHEMRGRLPKDHHFFVGVDSGRPSRYGWVKSLDDEISPEDLAGQYRVSPTEALVSACGRLLEAIKNHDDGTPFACSFSTVGILEKKKVMKIHKVIFYETS